ncbi:hypothetical protein IFM89_019221 [Coptis chinensis]|uniref:Uncharacterized protein n=1 Tax=Coptis chinensis TaxID=261450 RepID=A0A835MD06_9MAGN|nr:hypothetical protein IFM89_019221 [Coptis chinensis]
MGRNLVCVYSKKHMNDVPELAEMKRRANTRSLKEMALLLRSGSQIIWIAPSGGRDRPDPITGEWFPDTNRAVIGFGLQVTWSMKAPNHALFYLWVPANKALTAPFDASAVDNIRRLADHCGVPRHIYPLALMCYDIMPPPAEVEKDIGERRVISFHGVGVSVAPEINFDEISSGHENPDEDYQQLLFLQVKMDFSHALYKSVAEQYNVLNSAIYGNQGLKASASTVSLSQPWKSQLL